MRRPTTRVTALAVALGLGLAACGGDDPEQPPATPPGGPGAETPPTIAPPPETDPPDHGWEGMVEIDFETGELTVAGFNELIEQESPGWAADPVTTAEVLLRLDTADGQIDTDQEADNGDPVVVVVNSQLADDSVEAIRYRIVLTEGDDGLHQFASGAASWRCQPERGHQDFDTEPCL